jgi:Ca2+-binding EF-hand superfamily protein
MNENGKVKLTELINILMLDPLDMKSSVMSTNKMSSWKDKIIVFDPSKASEYKKSFAHLIKVFEDIRKKLINEKIEELFNSIFVTIDGECDEMDFIHIMGKYNVGKSSYFINFLEFFKNKKSKRFEVITFINAYNSIFFEGGEPFPVDVSVEKNQNLSKTLIQEKKPQVNNTQEANKTAPSKFVNKNERGVSDDDLEYIKDVVNFIEPIISNEKRKSVIEFFKGYDKQRVGYFSKDIFMKILDDLEVDTQEGDEINVKYGNIRYSSITL